MERTAIDQPGVFFATCAQTDRPEVKLTIEQTHPGYLCMEDWQVMRETIAAVRIEIVASASLVHALFLGNKRAIFWHLTEFTR